MFVVLSFHLVIDDLLDTYWEVAAHSSSISRLYLNPIFTEGSLRVGEGVVHQSHTELPSLKSKLVYWEGMLFLVHTTVVEVQALYGTPGVGPPVHVPLNTVITQGSSYYTNICIVQTPRVER